MAGLNNNRAIQVGPPGLPLDLLPGQDFGPNPMAAMQQRQMAAEAAEMFRQGAAAAQREDALPPEAMIRLEAERDRGRKLDAQIAAQQSRNERLGDALEGRTADIDKPAPGTRHHPRHWYGDDSADKADREAGGRRTIRKIRQAEDAEKAGREDRYEKGITSGLKGTEGEYERKVEIYSQMSPEEMNENYGGPRALTKPLYWENPKTGEREITEAHKDYDPRKLKPVYYTDNQGRPRVKLKKVGRKKPISAHTGRRAPVGGGAAKAVGPIRTGLPGSSDPGRAMRVLGGLPGVLLNNLTTPFAFLRGDVATGGLPARGRVGISDTAVGRGREHPEGAYTAAEDPDATEEEKQMERMAMPPGPEDQGKLSDEERAIADDYLSAGDGSVPLSEAPGRIFGDAMAPLVASARAIKDLLVGDKSSGEEAAASGDGELTRAQRGDVGARGPAGVRGAVGDEGPAGVAGEGAEAGADEYDPAEDWTIGETDKALARAGQPRIGEEDPLAEKPRFAEVGEAAMEAEDKPSVISDPEEIQRRVAEEEEALVEGGGVPFEVTNAPVVGGEPEPPAVFGDPSSTFERPGPTEDQLAKRAAEKDRLESRGAYADAIRHGRRVAKEQARNAPRFWYTRTGDPRADAAIAAQMAQQMGGVLREQIKGRTAREQMMGEQVRYDKALKFKSQDQLRQIASDPMTPHGLREAARRQFALNAGLDVPAAGGAAGAGGSRVPAGQAAAQLEAQNPGMMGQIEGAISEYNEDIGGHGTIGDLMEGVSGWFGGDVHKTNSDQLSYMAQNLAGLISSGQITGDNIALVGPIIGAKLHRQLRAELSSPQSSLSRGGVAWSDIQQFMNDVIAGRMPANYEGLVSPSRTGGLFGWSGR